MTERSIIFNRQHEELRTALTEGRDAQKAIELFLTSMRWSMRRKSPFLPHRHLRTRFWEDLSEAGARRIPPKSEHSIAWIFWHITRIEDTTMNLLVAGTPQVFTTGQWKERLNVTIQDFG